MIKIYYWSTGHWCHEDELSQMTHLSDDYGVLEISVDTDEHCIDALVREAIC